MAERIVDDQPQKAAGPDERCSGLWSNGFWLRAVAACALALCAANCSTRASLDGRHPSELRYGVKSSPRVVADGEPIPKGGGRETLGNPYVVAGRTYVPHPGRGYVRQGSASWYGAAFHGRLTANGEIFDRESIAAAHPTLPLPSYVRVTNLANNRSMIVRVNDRGPYERGRLIDVSERVAEALGFRTQGTGQVRVEYAGKASLSGSDYAKLLATLRTDGGPASFDTYGRRAFASNEPVPQSAGGRVSPRRDEDRAIGRREPPRADGASSGDAPPPPGPRSGRPDLAGIY